MSPGQDHPRPIDWTRRLTNGRDQQTAGVVAWPRAGTILRFAYRARQTTADRTRSAWSSSGAGPAGLTAAYELDRLGAPHKAIVLEESDKVGGIARTESYKGFRFDIGGHRFFTKVSEVDALWHEVCGSEFPPPAAPEPHLLSQQVLRLPAEAPERAA
jgi:hypothetical protein